MTTTRDEIERLVDYYLTDIGALESCIGTLEGVVAERDARIAALEKALRPLYGAALNAVCMVGIDGGNAEIDAEAMRVLDEQLDAAKAALAQPEQEGT